MIAASYKTKKKFMQLAIAEAKRARDRGDYAIGAVITRVTDGREVVIASAGNRVKTSGSSIKHVELETLKLCCVSLYVATSAPFDQNCASYVKVSQHKPNLENEVPPKSMGVVGHSELCNAQQVAEEFFYEAGCPLSGRSELLWIQARYVVTSDFAVSVPDPRTF